MRLTGVWLMLICVVGLFSLLYLWYTLFPGRVAPAALDYFSVEQINRGRQYNLMPRLMFIGSFLAQVSFLLWLVFSGKAVKLSHLVQLAAGGNYWGSIILFFLLLWVVLQLLQLPFTLYSTYFWQHQWGFSTQALGAWWLDYLKSAGLGLVISTAGVILLFSALNRWPGTWWLAGAAFVSFWLLGQTFLWPVVISPLFNRFEPAKDPAVISMVRELSAAARLPVDQVLIMDASRRTTKANAYFAGIGRTKQIVLYDTLLAAYPLDEVKAVVAHEMAHWSRGHITRGLMLGICGNFILWGLLFLLIRTPAAGSLTRSPPHVWAVILLFFLLASFAATPLQNYFSRGMEKEADRTAAALTGDAPATIRLQVDLAAKNLSDVAPAPFIQWFSYSHPAAPERIEIISNGGE